MRPDRAAALAAAFLLAGAGAGAPASGAPASGAEAAVVPPAASAPVATPLDLFGPLYRRVELERLFPDSKTFADAVPKEPPAAILAAYLAAPPPDRAGLLDFVHAHFDLPAAITPAPAAASDTSPRQPMAAHIAALWPELTRTTREVPPGGSALALPKPYVVPGGRFRELYYWDSYFTFLGLKADGRDDLLESTLDDFGSLIDRYGHIPNGARTYYVSRSQPPFFYAMAALSKSRDPAVLARRLRQLQAEHAWWMAGAHGLKPGEAEAHLVRLPDGGLLNRPFDTRDTPREESYAEDVALARSSGRPERALYRDLRAAAETGWDFSSRWLADGRTLASIHTTDIVPADLNSLLFGLERAIADRCRAAGETACARRYDALAEARALEMRRWLWDAGSGVFRDYDWRAGRRTPALTAAVVYPLFTGLASPGEARLTARAVEKTLLAPGGLRTTTERTGQQWDAPNGWAPLQWLAVSGLRRYGQGRLADVIACRWMKTVEASYARSGRLLEKYDVEERTAGGGGEYPLQDGFGWTNGVALALARGGHCKTEPLSNPM